MNLRLAIDTLAISHDDNLVVRLRPSLRAGYSIACKYSVGEVYHAVSQMSVTVITHLVELGADDPLHARKVLDTIITEKGVLALGDHIDTLLRFVAISLGMSAPDDEPTPVEETATEGGKFDFKTALENLFRIGTGWLGWTPETTWSAAPVEIIAAQRAHLEKLQAIHGTGEATNKADTYDPRDIPSEAEVKANFAALKEKMRGF